MCSALMYWLRNLYIILFLISKCINIHRVTVPAASCKQTFSRLFNRLLFNRFDNRLYRVNGVYIRGDKDIFIDVSYCSDGRRPQWSTHSRRLTFSSLCRRLFTGSIARSANLPVFSLLRGQFWGFSPRRGDTLHRWGWNLAWRRGPYPLRDFHKIWRVCSTFQDALGVKIWLDLLKGLWSYGSFKLRGSGFPQIFSAP